MILTTVNQKLEIVLAGAVGTNQLPFVCDWTDVTTTTTTPGVTHGVTSGATPVDLVPVPGSSPLQRVIRYVNIYNADTAAATVTVRYNDSATLRTIQKFTLQVGESMIYDGSWKVLDAVGAVKTAQSGTGRWLRTVVLTAGTTYTTGPQATSLFVRLVGGGGGGGGCTSVASAAGAGGGGGAGSYAEKTFAVTPNTNYTYQVGAQGNGVSGAAGANGTASTFIVGGVTVTAPFGSGGILGTAATTLTARAGGAGGAIATNGDVNGAGENGSPGFILIVSGSIGQGGSGGNTQFGKGGLGITAAGNGNAATGYGAGGGGALTAASAVRTGGNGTPGIIIVDEYA